MKYSVGACLAFRNCSAYLREWMEFHRAFGVEHFYLYNNDSVDDYASVLAPYLASGEAELIAWPGYYQQGAIYDDCLNRAREECEWVAFIDDDEFLFSEGGEPLPSVLDRYRSFAGVAVSWHLYGTSGLLYHQLGNVVDRFVKRAPGVDQHHKMIVQPRLTAKCLCGGHLFAPVPGQTLVRQDRLPVEVPVDPHPVGGPLRLNHYMMKSIEEFLVRRSDRDIGTGDRLKRPLVDWIRDDKNWCAVHDDIAGVLFRQRLAAARRREQIEPALACAR